MLDCYREHMSDSMYAALESLSAKEIEAVVFVWLEGFTELELARKRGESRSAVSLRLFRAKEKVRLRVAF